MRIEDGHLVLSTGRRVYLHRGTVGLSAKNTDERWLFDGSSFELDFGGTNAMDSEQLDPEEAIELADHMIAMWHRFRTYSDQRARTEPIRMPRRIAVRAVKL